MREFIEIINKNVNDVSKVEQKEILNFLKRLQSYIHVPSNEKEINRMKAFSSKKFLVNFILKNLENYPYPRISTYPFDIISYWYCIALLILSEDTKGKDYVFGLAKQFIKNEHLDLWQFRRLLEFINIEEYGGIKKEIELYFLSKQNDLDSYKWAKQIGLELPKDNSWMLFFELSTDGKFRFGNDLTELEKEKRLRMTISVYPLQGERCWEIELKNWNNSISAWWPNLTEREIRLSKKKNNYVLKTEPSILNLKEVINEVETVFNVKFDKTIYSKRFKGKIRNKNAVQKWLNI
jgi:ribosomal protein L23